MLRSPRSRQVLKWGTTGGLAAVLLIWAASGWWYCWGIGSRVGFGISGGQFSIAALPANLGVQPGWTLARTPEFDPWPGLPNAGSVGGTVGAYFVSIPFWILAIPAAALTIVAWRRDAIAKRHERLGNCCVCNYDLSGLADGTACPECGSPPTRQGSLISPLPAS